MNFFSPMCILRNEPPRYMYTCQIFFYKTGDGNLIESRKLFSSCQKAVKNDLQHLKKCASKVDHIVSIVHNSQVFERCINLRSDTAPNSQKLPLKTKHMWIQYFDTINSNLVRKETQLYAIKIRNNKNIIMIKKTYRHPEVVLNEQKHWEKLPIAFCLLAVVPDNRQYFVYCCCRTFSRRRQPDWRFLLFEFWFLWKMIF